MSETLTQLGIGGVLAIMVLKETFGFVRGQKRNVASGCSRPEDVEEIKRMIKDLHTWHQKEDEDGVKVWYIRKSLERAIKDLSEVIQQQTEVVRRMLDRENG